MLTLCPLWGQVCFKRLLEDSQCPFGENQQDIMSNKEDLWWNVPTYPHSPETSFLPCSLWLLFQLRFSPDFGVQLVEYYCLVANLLSCLLTTLPLRLQVVPDAHSCSQHSRPGSPSSWLCPALSCQMSLLRKRVSPLLIWEGSHRAPCGCTQERSVSWVRMTPDSSLNVLWNWKC